jgi:hypothetical protein
MTHKNKLLFREVKRFVNNTTKSGKMSEFYEILVKHFDRTVYWLLQLDPDSTLAERIAAYSHDIERSYKGNVDLNSTNEDRKVIHQEAGGENMRAFLEERNTDKALQEEVKNLISKHEIGGNSKQNKLKDADSISFLENNVDLFVNVFLEKRGYQGIKNKFSWMFDRITSDKAKQLAKPYYKRAMEKLEKAN